MNFRNRNEHRVWSTAAVALIISSLTLDLSYGATVTNQGGYSVLVSIDESIPEPENTEQYFQQIRSSFNVFSTQLWRATHGKFFINSVDLLVPPEWNVTDAQPATTQSIAGADIRLLNETTLPYVDNPNACGLPGYRIEVPYTFFSYANDGPYGPTWKALMTLWARFRFGVWEEHGFPGNSRFPYFYLGDEPDVWHPASCSDVPLVGTFEDTNGEECSVKQAERPSETCRFNPGPQNTASSSFMSFHWIHSISHFCDANTHNKLSPNRQNLFCNYRSVWEVIRETPDYNAAKFSRKDVPVVQFRMVQKLLNARPIYVLIDRGQLNPEVTKIMVQVIPETAKLFSEKMDDRVVAAIGEYPPPDGKTQEVLSWSPIENVMEEILDVIGNIPADGTEVRDFTVAIQAAIHYIESLNSVNGAVLFVVKGGTFNSTDMTYEESIYAMLMNSKIQLYVAEVTASDEIVKIPTSLKHLAERTGGTHMEFDDFRTVGANMSTLTDDIAKAVITPVDPDATVEVLIQSVAPLPDTPTVVDVSRNSTVYIRLTTPKSVEAVMTITGPTNPDVEITDEWGMTEEDARQTHSYTHVYNPGEDEISVSYKCAVANCNGEKAQLFITEDLHPDQNYESNRVVLTLSTSASSLGGVIDFETSPVSFALHAKVELDGKPVAGAIVKASVDTPGGLYTFNLLDDGLGNPDIQAEDGVYSGIFIPPADGPYSPSVQVLSDASSRVALTNQGGVSSRLLPIEQNEFGCGPGRCDAITFTEKVSRAEAVPSFTVMNFAAYPGRGRAERIVDFAAQKSKTVTNQLNFLLTSPRIIGTTEQALRFEVYGAASLASLIGDNQGELVESFENDIKPGEPVILSTQIKNPNHLYFAVQSFSGEPPMASELSAVARLYEESPISGTTPPSASSGPTTDATNPTAGTTEPPDDTPFFESAGGIALIVFLVLLVVTLAAVGGFLIYRKRRGGFSTNP